ncbi:hypothetical protein N7526_000161 [Penicillium atrosanguineum]|nr:hypothetical protein N7526_000161 [Penicillium atrosanguineum]
MPSFIKFAAAALAVAAPLASAQTYTSCNPLDKTCPADAGTTESHLSFDFTQSGSLDKWTTTAGTVNTGANGAEFTLAKRGDAPTIETDFYMLFGEISITMKAAPGQGVVSSLVFESDDLDEIDWEALGGDTTQIETNYFGKGDTTTYDRATWPAVSDPQNTWHTYTVSWQQDATTWSVDGNVVRTLNYADAQGGARYPKPPCASAWGTIEWAGGETNYAGAPYTMYVKSVDIVNANPAESYTWTDKSGSYQSIKKSGAASLNQSSSSESSTTASSTESKTATETSTSTTATTLATTTQTSTAARTTSGSTTAGSSSNASTTGSSTAGSSSSSSPGSSSNAGSGSTSGSASSTAGSGSGSGSSTTPGSGSSSSSSSSSSAATTSPAFNAAASVTVGPLGLLALLAVFIQL